jgi:hypothetical protein
MVPKQRDNLPRTILRSKSMLSIAVTGGEKVSLLTEILLLPFPQILDVSSPSRVS